MLAALIVAGAIVWGNGPVNAGDAILQPSTLRPAGPALPLGVVGVEPSPDGTRIAVAAFGEITFRDARTGEPLGPSVRIGVPVPTLSWVAPDRLLLIECCRPFRVRAVQPSTGGLIGDSGPIDRGLIQTARVGERQVVLTYGPGSLPADADKALSIFSADGELERSVPLPDPPEFPGLHPQYPDLHPRSPTGTVLVLSDYLTDTLIEVDPGTGTITLHRLSTRADGWVVPGEGDMLAVSVGGEDGAALVDPKTFEITRKVREPAGLHHVAGAGAGFVIYEPDAKGRRFPMHLFDANGHRIASFHQHPDDTLTAGRWLYTRSSGSKRAVRIFDTRTGKLRRTFRGRRAHITGTSVFDVLGER